MTKGEAQRSRWTFYEAVNVTFAIIVDGSAKSFETRGIPLSEFHGSERLSVQGAHPFGQGSGLYTQMPD